jgi:hypothetical protein
VQPSTHRIARARSLTATFAAAMEDFYDRVMNSVILEMTADIIKNVGCKKAKRN